MSHRLVQFSLDRADPTEGPIAAMVDHLQHNDRAVLKLWFLKACHECAGEGEAAEMAKRLKNDLLGRRNLETGHQRDQNASQPLGRERPSAPLSPPVPAAPIHRPDAAPDLVKADTAESSLLM